MEEYGNQQQYGRTEDNREQLTLLDIWNIVWYNKWWFLACVVICLLGAGLYLYKTPSTYLRSAKLIVDESAQDAAVRNLSSFTGGGMRLRNTVAVENEMEAFTSPDLMLTVVERNNLQTVYVEKQFLRDVELYTDTPLELSLEGGNPTGAFSFVIKKRSDGSFILGKFRIGKEKISKEVEGRPGEKLATPVGNITLHPTANFGKWDDDIAVSRVGAMARAKACCARLTAEISSKESTVIVLSYKDCFPSRAENILNSLIDVYNEVWLFDQNQSARNTISFITDRLSIIEGELGGIESDLKAYKVDNNISDVRALAQQYLEESSTYAEQLFAVSNQLSIAGFIKDYLNDPANSSSLIPSNLGIANQSVESQIKEYNTIVLQRDRYRTSGSGNPMVEDLNASILAMRSAILRSVDNLIAALRVQESGLKQQESRILERISTSSNQEFELISMQRQQKVKESLYIFLLQKREENEMAALVNVGNTRVIMRPNGSPAPVAPRTVVMLFLALVFGCGIPLGYFILLSLFDTKVKSKMDLTSLKLPFLAEIPLSVVKKGKLGKLGLKKKAFDESNCKIIVKAGRRNMMNEAYRVFRTNLDLILGKKDSQVIMFTSINPNAGKTFNVINIAAAMAIKPAKTVLVDLDLRKASLSSALGIENRSGASSYLNGDVSSLEGITVNVTGSLDCIPVGVLPPNPTELLLSDRFPEMIAELRRNYAYVFIDCPPIEIVADSAIVTQYVDLTVFVMRSGLFDRSDLPKLNGLYAENRYTRMCAVLNGVQMGYKVYSKSRYGGGYGYGYGYGNSDQDENE